eukprot:10504348-Lingulodinium_polyedra.AAC.1
MCTVIPTFPTGTTGASHTTRRRGPSISAAIAPLRSSRGRSSTSRCTSLCRSSGSSRGTMTHTLVGQNYSRDGTTMR